MTTASIDNESMTLVRIPVSFSFSSFSVLFLTKTKTSTPRADNSFSMSSMGECLLSHSLVAEMTTECLAWDKSLRNNF